MRPLEFYELGLQIASSASTEAQYRTAISRIYYGLHHEACCRYFRKLPTAQPLDGNRRHAELRNRFSILEDSAAIRVGQLLGRLRILRTEADYQLRPPLRFGNRSYTPEQLMAQAIMMGQDLLEGLEVFSPGEASDGCECPHVYSSR